MDQIRRRHPAVNRALLPLQCSRQRVINAANFWFTTLVQLDDIVRGAAPYRPARDFAVDHGFDHADWQGLRPDSHEIVDLETAVDADRLVGADDLFDRS